MKKYLFAFSLLLLLLYSGFSLSSSTTQIFLYNESPRQFNITITDQHFSSSSSNIRIITPNIFPNYYSSTVDSARHLTVNVSIYKNGVFQEYEELDFTHCSLVYIDAYQWSFFGLFNFTIPVDDRKILGCSTGTYPLLYSFGGINLGVQFLSDINSYLDIPKQVFRTDSKGLFLINRASFSTDTSSTNNYTFTIDFSFPSVADENALLNQYPRTYYVEVEEVESGQVLFGESTLVKQIITYLIDITLIVIALYKIGFVTIMAVGIILFPVFLFALARETFAKFTDTVSVSYDDLGEAK